MKLNRVIAACAALTFPALGAADMRGHGAHEHGRATLDVAALGGELEIVLQAPAMDIIGFEHEPATTQQRAVLREALERLRQPGDIFELPAAADCHARAAEARRVAGDHRDGEHHENHRGEGGHGHGGGGNRAHHEDAEHHHDRHAGDEHAPGEHGYTDQAGGRGSAEHAEVHAHYHFDCADPGALDRLQVRLFEHFDSLEEVRVQLVTDTTQSAARLRPGAARLEW